MKLAGTYRFEADRETVYRFLLDPETIKACLPGCERLEAAGPDVFEALMKVGVPGLKGTFTGKVQIKEREPPRAFKMLVEGSGPTGFVKGEGKLELVEAGSGTDVAWAGDVQVGGLIASVGQRMLGGVANMVTNQFFKALESRLGETAG